MSGTFSSAYRNSTSVLLVTAAFGTFVSRAEAVTPPPARFTGQLLGTVGTINKRQGPTKIGSYQFTLHDAKGTSTPSLVFTASPSPGISVAGTTTGSGTHLAYTSATVIYYFQVVGPKAKSVPVIASASGSISGTSSAISSGALVQVSTNRGNTKFPVSGSCPDAYPQVGSFKYVVVCGAYNAPVTVNVTASTKTSTAATNEVLMLVSDNVTSAGTAAASASVMLQIDPSFADAGKYRIVVSKGIGNP
jgi:hypothetical protein